MVTFWVQLLDLWYYGQLHYFTFFFIYVWVVWSTKAVVSRFYRVVTSEYQATVSVVIPVCKEDPEVFSRVLASIRQNHPEEIIVVLNGQWDEALEGVCKEHATDVLRLPEPNKRRAMATAIRLTKGKIVVIVDSDTVWYGDTLSEMIKPFADPKVGGVTTDQRIFNPNANLIRRFCAWMEDLRWTYSTPAQSVFGSVGCLPGRTIAFRREWLLTVLEEFLKESFLEERLTIGDDRSLTNFCLRDGWRTVYQRSSRVLTDCPNSWRRFILQQIRWARSSQRETIRQRGWLIRKPLLAFCFTTDIITPFFLAAVFANIAWRFLTGTAYTPIIEGTVLANLPAQITLAVFGSLVSIGVRQIPHFLKKPQDLWFLPVFVVVLTIIMVPVRIWGFMTMAENNWMTRPETGGVTGGVNEETLNETDPPDCRIADPVDTRASGVGS